MFTSNVRILYSSVLVAPSRYGLLTVCTWLFYWSKVAVISLIVLLLYM